MDESLFRNRLQVEETLQYICTKEKMQRYERERKTE